MGSVSDESFSRAVVEPVVIAETSLFTRSNRESACVLVAQDGFVEVFDGMDAEVVLDALVTSVMGLPPSDARYPAARAILDRHRTEAMDAGASERVALQSALALACMAPGSAGMAFETSRGDAMNSKKTWSRRRALGAFGTAGGSLILGAMATGIPARVLLDPLSAEAQEEGLRPARMLILSVSAQGDPVNANVPGTYDDSMIAHPADPAMAPTELRMSGRTSVAARPWADLGPGVLDRMAFIHHATYTPVHGEMGRVQRLMEATEKNDMLISLFSRELAPRLGTVQSDPVSLGANGGELLTSAGRVLGNVAPLSVRQALGGVDGPLRDLQLLRDRHIDEIYALYREAGTPNQLKMLDAWVRSRDEVRTISDDLMGRLESITANDQANQVRCATILAAMNIAPVITVRMNFGRDNHADADLATETEGHLQSVPAIGALMAELDQMRADGTLAHDVLFGSLNVFGRTHFKKGRTGRDHNAGHHCLVLAGTGIRGGIALNDGGNEFIAQSIDSETGAVGGHIPFEETLGAAGKTLGAALGIAGERLDQIVGSGKVVRSVLG
ncbi:MAG: hypothetical protein AAGA56_08465 [Myxococcota bacterium]